MIAIECVHDMDNESWELLKAVIEEDMCFIVMSICEGRLEHMCSAANDVIHHQCTRLIKLGPIDKWYHAGLACQVLDVKAIPPDLER